MCPKCAQNLPAGALYTPSPGGHLLKKSLPPRLRLRDGSGCNSAVRGWLYAVLHRHCRRQGVCGDLQKAWLLFLSPMGFEPTETPLSPLHTSSHGKYLLKKSLSPWLRLRDGSGCNSAVRGWLYAVLHRHRRSQGVGRNLQKNEARNFFPPMGFEPTENDLSGGLLAPYPITRKNLLASAMGFEPNHKLFGGCAGSMPHLPAGSSWSQIGKNNSKIVFE